MNKLIAAVVASTFALGSVAGFAADTVKNEELTKEQRTEMRDRADRLTQERAQAGTQVKTDARTAPATKTPHVKKVSRHHTAKTQPKT